jgi:engulfment and cell motility protein 1
VPGKPTAASIHADFQPQIVDLVVAQPLVNVNRGAMSVLAAIVGHPSHRNSQAGVTGFQRLKPAVDTQPQFLPALVESRENHLS